MLWHSGMLLIGGIARAFRAAVSAVALRMYEIVL